MNGARQAILGRLRDGLAGSRVPDLPAVPPLRELRACDLVAQFASMVQRVGGVCEVVPDLPAAAARIAAVVAAERVRTLATSDAPELVSLLPDGVAVLRPDAPRDQLLLAGAGLTTAQWGIAETGTLVLVATAERHRLASLLPPLHLVVLPTARLLGTLAHTLVRLQGPDGTPAARTITFVTGPSRTADIELELVVGVHGPRTLHVLLVHSA